MSDPTAILKFDKFDPQTNGVYWWLDISGIIEKINSSRFLLEGYASSFFLELRILPSIHQKVEGIQSFYVTTNDRSKIEILKNLIANNNTFYINFDKTIIDNVVVEPPRT